MEKNLSLIVRRGEEQRQRKREKEGENVRFAMITPVECDSRPINKMKIRMFRKMRFPRSTESLARGGEEKSRIKPFISR